MAPAHGGAQAAFLAGQLEVAVHTHKVVLARSSVLLRPFSAAKPPRSWKLPVRCWPRLTPQRLKPHLVVLADGVTHFGKQLRRVGAVVAFSVWPRLVTRRVVSMSCQV
jgi:hypothetical protein